MKTNLRGKIREFIQSEEGKVGIKSPLTLGVATGSILLAQALIPTTASAHGDCDCDEGQICLVWETVHWPGPTVVEHTQCVNH